MRSAESHTPSVVHAMLTEIVIEPDTDGDESPIDRGWRLLSAAHTAFRIRVATALRQLDDLARSDEDE